jgi:hypothetical protein
VVRMYIVWFVVPMGFFVRKLMFYLHVYRVAAVGVGIGLSTAQLIRWQYIL